MRARAKFLFGFNPYFLWDFVCYRKVTGKIFFNYTVKDIYAERIYNKSSEIKHRKHNQK